MTEDDISKLAHSYCTLLNSLNWRDPLLRAGIKEGLSKFLSNAYISMKKRHKHLTADYYSRAAAQQLRLGNHDGLTFEHVVPKSEYIQKRCEALAREGRLEEHEIADLLRKYWKIAVITAEENKTLLPTKMPPGWDGMDVLHRYRAAGIELLRAEEVNLG